MKKDMQKERDKYIDLLSSWPDRKLDAFISDRRCAKCSKWMKRGICPKEYDLSLCIHPDEYRICRDRCTDRVTIGRRSGDRVMIGRQPVDPPCSEFEPNFYYSIALEMKLLRKLTDV